MKKQFIITLIFALAFAGSYGQATIYHPFPTSNATWTEGNSIQYGIFGDTIIYSLSYHKMYRRETCSDTTMSEINSTLDGAIREDGFKRIYYYPLNSFYFCQPDTSYKLYDFSKLAGDTIVFDTTMGYSCYYPKFLVINNIDSVLINNSYRKRYNFLNSESWIEGIGSVRSLFSSVAPRTTCGCDGELTCHRQDGMLYYLNPNYYHSDLNRCFCDITTGVNDITVAEKSVTISQNPFSTITTIQTGEILKNAVLIIYNSLGQQVRDMKNINGEEIILQRGDLPAGIYFMQLTEQNKLLSSHKLIVNDEY